MINAQDYEGPEGTTNDENEKYVYKIEQESRAMVRKPGDAADVRCGLMFADIHYKFKSSQGPKARLHSSRHTCEKNRI